MARVKCCCCGGISETKPKSYSEPGWTEDGKPISYPNSKGFYVDPYCEAVLEIVDEKTGKTKLASLEQTAEYHAEKLMKSVAEKIVADKITPRSSALGTFKRDLMDAMIGVNNYNAKGRTIDEFVQIVDAEFEKCSELCELLIEKNKNDAKEQETNSKEKGFVKETLKKIKNRISTAIKKEPQAESTQEEQAKEPGELS